MLQYDNPVLHTNLWEEIENRPWAPLVESKGSWKNHDYITVNNTNAFKTGVREKEYSSKEKFLTDLRKERVEKHSNGKFPVIYYIGFINPVNLDKVEFLVTFNDLETAILEVTTSQAIISNKLKTSYEYGNGSQSVTRTPEPDKKAQNTLTWSEKTIKSTVPIDKCRELLKKAIDRLKIKKFREIKPDEDFHALLKRNENYKNYIVNMQKFNEVFNTDLYEAKETIVDDINFVVPGSARDFDNYQNFLKYIHPKNLLEFPIKFPLDVYIQFASRENGRVACLWVSYPEKPVNRKKNVRITLFTAVPYMYKKTPQKVVIGTVRNKNDLRSVVQSDDLYIDFNTSRKHYDSTAVDGWMIIKKMILKLLGNGFSILPEGEDILEFAFREPGIGERPKVTSPGRGRPKGSTKKKEW